MDTVIEMVMLLSNQMMAHYEYLRGLHVVQTAIILTMFAFTWWRIEVNTCKLMKFHFALKDKEDGDEDQ